MSKHPYYRQKTIYVRLECTREQVNEKSVKFVDIEEDFQGRDVLTFECSKCGKNHKSHRVG